MGGPQTVVKNPSPDKKSLSENTRLVLTFRVFECFISYFITYNFNVYNKNADNFYIFSVVMRVNSISRKKVVI